MPPTQSRHSQKHRTLLIAFSVGPQKGVKNGKKFVAEFVHLGIYIYSQRHEGLGGYLLLEDQGRYLCNAYADSLIALRLRLHKKGLLKGRFFSTK